MAREKRGSANPNTCPLNRPSHNRQWPGLTLVQPHSTLATWPPPSSRPASPGGGRCWKWVPRASLPLSWNASPSHALQRRTGACQSTGTPSVLDVCAQATSPRTCSAKTCGHGAGTRSPAPLPPKRRSHSPQASEDTGRDEARAPQVSCPGAHCVSASLSAPGPPPGDPQEGCRDDLRQASVPG